MDPLRLDYTHALDSAVGPDQGLSESDLAALAPRLGAALDAVQARRTQDLRWLDLPHETDERARLLAFAEAQRGRFENVVVLGIGGSALGNRALHTALNSPYHDLLPPQGRPRLFVLDNVDPDLVGAFSTRSTRRPVCST